MDYIELLRQNGLLITDKQYKIIIIKMILMLTISSIIWLGGLAITIITESLNRTLFIIGLSMLAVGAFLFFLDVMIIIFRYYAKIQTYRDYKKYPEDFESKSN